MDFSMTMGWTDQVGLVATFVSMIGYVGFMRAFSAEQRIRQTSRVRQVRNVRRVR